MKLTYFILPILLISKSFSIPFFSKHSLDTAMANHHEKNCYETKAKTYPFNQLSEINKILANTTIRSPIAINNAMNNTCGAILYAGSYYSLDVSNGIIPKKNCSESIICDRTAPFCSNAFACSDGDDNRDAKYQLISINKNSTDYNKAIADCKAMHPDTKCYKLEKIQLPTSAPTSAPTETPSNTSNNNASTTLAISTPNSAKVLISVLYLYFLGVVSCIQSQ